MNAARTFAVVALLFAVSAALPFACCAFPSTAAMPICGQMMGRV